MLQARRCVNGCATSLDGGRNRRRVANNLRRCNPPTLVRKTKIQPQGKQARSLPTTLEPIPQTRLQLHL